MKEQTDTWLRQHLIGFYYEIKSIEGEKQILFAGNRVLPVHSL